MYLITRTVYGHPVYRLAHDRATADRIAAEVGGTVSQPDAERTTELVDLRDDTYDARMEAADSWL